MFFYEVGSYMQKLSSFGREEEKKYSLKSHLRCFCRHPFNYKQHHREVLLSSFHLNCHTFGFFPQTHLLRVTRADLEGVDWVARHPPKFV